MIQTVTLIIYSTSDYAAVEINLKREKRNAKNESIKYCSIWGYVREFFQFYFGFRYAKVYLSKRKPFNLLDAFK